MDPQEDPNVKSTFRATIVVEFEAYGKRHAGGHLSQIINYGIESIDGAKEISSDVQWVKEV